MTMRLDRTLASMLSVLFLIAFAAVAEDQATKPAGTTTSTSTPATASAPAKPRTKAMIEAEKKIALAYGKPVVVDCKNGHLIEALDYLAKVGGFEFEMEDETFKAKPLDLVVNCLSLEQALSLVTRMYGLDYRLQDGQVYIFTPEPPRAMSDALKQKNPPEWAKDMDKKLTKKVLPKVSFNNLDSKSAVDLLHAMKIVDVLLDPDLGKATPVFCEGANMTFKDVLGSVASSADLEVRYVDGVVWITKAKEAASQPTSKPV